jgi:hypothetical protein
MDGLQQEAPDPNHLASLSSQPFRRGDMAIFFVSSPFSIGGLSDCFLENARY